MSLMYAYFLLNMKKTQDPNYLFPRLLIEVVCMAIKLERRGHISMGTMSNIEHAHCWGQSRCTGGSHLHGPDLFLEDSDKKMMYTADTHAGNIKHLASWSFMSLTKEWQETKLCFISKIKKSYLQPYNDKRPSARQYYHSLIATSQKMQFFMFWFLFLRKGVNLLM